MTLSELATQVSTVTGFVEDDDISAAKSFLTAKHRLMWNHQLWKDSLVEYNVTLSPDDYTPASVWLPTAGVLLLPATIQKVLAVRSSDYHLNVQRQEYYYRIDYNAFAAQGSPYEFVVLPPCVWQLNEVHELFLRSAGTEVNSVTTDTVAADEVSIDRIVTAITAGDTSITDSDRVDVVQKPATTNAVDVVLHDWFLVEDSGIAAVNGAYLKTAHAGSFDGFRWVNPASGYYMENQNDAYWGIFSAAEVVQCFGNPPPGPFNTPEIVGIGVPVASYFPIISLTASDTNAPKRQRIRFVRIPSDETTVRVLGKRNPPSFSNDSDEPAITGCEDYLIAFASAQMWERARQFGKKELLMQEADALLGDLIKQETVQQAHHISITPETGMGGDYYAYGGYSGIAW